MNLKRLLTAGVLIFSLGVPWNSWAEELVIIINGQNSVGALSLTEVRKLYLKEQTAWSNGAKIRSVDRIGNPPGKRAFLEKVIQMSPDEMEKYWVAKRYEKGVPVPPKLRSDQQVIEYVLSFEGAIGYVASKSIGPGEKSQLKVVGSFPMP